MLSTVMRCCFGDGEPVGAGGLDRKVYGVRFYMLYIAMRYKDMAEFCGGFL